MSRISLDPRLADSDYLAERIRRVKRSRRRGSTKLKFCCLPIVILLLTSLIFITVCIAKTGIWNIPIASKFFYQVPKPSRTVSVNNPASIASAPLNLAPDSASGLSTLTITEQQLTFLLRQTLTGKANSFFAPSLQAAINPDNIEFFGLMVKPVTANIIIKATPQVNNKVLTFNINEAVIGNLAVPINLAHWFMDRFLPIPVTNIGSAYPQLALADVKLERGKINFLFTLNNQ